MTRIPVLAAALAAVIAFALGAVAHQQFSLHEDTLSRAVRTGLGLPKAWRTDRNRDTAAHRPVDCPPAGEAIVIVTGGQSNAANTNSASHVAAEGSGSYMFFEGRCYAAADPVLGATGGRGSLWSLFGERLAAESGRPVVMAHTAIGGSETADWLDRRSGYLAYFEAVLADLRAAGHAPDLALWHQGETDAAVQPSAEAYEAVLRPLVDRLAAAAAPAPLYLFVTSKCIGPVRARGRDIIRDTQRRVADSHDAVIAGMNTDALGNDYRWDTCHFNSAGRQEIVGRVVADVLKLTGRS